MAVRGDPGDMYDALDIKGFDGEYGVEKWIDYCFSYGAGKCLKMELEIVVL
jgi:hypothetical protein